MAFCSFQTPSSVCYLGGHRPIFDNYPGDNDVLSISESEMRKRQQNALSASLEAYRSRTIFTAIARRKSRLFSNKISRKLRRCWRSSEELECVKEIVPETMVRLQNVAPFCDGTRRKKTKSLGCKAPEIMHEAGVKSFVHHLSLIQVRRRR